MVRRAGRYTGRMETALREVVVAPDRFEIATDDVVFRAELRSAIAVCVYDAVAEAGALLHLRFILRGAQPTDVTDTTLATELLLLDRCIEALREIAPGARHLQAKIAAHLPEHSTAVEACDRVLVLVSHFLRDARAEVAPADIAVGAPRRLNFRPAMGWVQVR
jgi:chemotaxis receptor (MCP) glutamine deamidase CheD